MNDQTRLRELVQETLSGRTANPVVFVDELLTLAREVGTIRGSLAGADALCFEVGDEVPLEVPLERAKGRFRACCARLGVLCNECGQDVNLFGGEGTIQKRTCEAAEVLAPSCEPQTWRVRFTNTMHRQEFVIQAQ